MKRILAFTLAVLMVVNVPTTVQAFSLKNAFKKISSSISAVVQSVNAFTDSSDSKTVYSYAELSRFLDGLFSPTKIRVKLGADITVPKNKTIGSVLHDVDMDMNGHTIYSKSSSYTIAVMCGRKWNVKNGTFVQQVSNTTGIIDALSGDATFTGVRFKKSSDASSVTGLYISGYTGKPKVTFENVKFDGMTTGLDIRSGGTVVLNNSEITHTQGDAVLLQDQYDTSVTGQSSFAMTQGRISYFKGNGIVAGRQTQTTLDRVTITGGTTRNRYGIRAAKDSQVKLTGTQVYANAGGNIGVNKCENTADCPVTIDSVASGSYSFTVMDKIASGDNKPYTVAKVTQAISGELENYPVFSDVSRYMVLAETGNRAIAIQNPPEQCETVAGLGWKAGTKALNTAVDAAYATVSINGSAESASGSVTTKYAQKITLSTTNRDPARYQFVGWEKLVGGQSKGMISTEQTCQVKAVDASASYQAVYQYRTYTLTVRTSGKGTVALSGASAAGQSGVTYTYYVDDTVNLTATPNAPVIDSKGKTTTYGFKKWNDGETAASRSITVKEDAVYTAMFTKTGQTTGTMYLGVKEITDTSQITSGTKLLLIYVGEVGNAQDNKLETSTGTVGITGLPDNSAKVTAENMTSSHKREAASTLDSGGIIGYGTGVTPKTRMLSVDAPVEGHGAGFDGCTKGFIEHYTWNKNGKTEDCWLYWCNGGGVKAVGPFALYSYTAEKTFDMNAVQIRMKDDYQIGRETQEIDKNSISAQVQVDGTTYDLGGLKFKADDLDDEINYSQGDRAINFELDGVPVDYNFPEATINGKQYTSLSEAVSAAKSSGETIRIVGPGVDEIAYDETKKVTLNNGVKIQGYDGDVVTAVGNSEIGIDKNGMVRLFDGELEVTPQENEKTSVGVRDAFATTDKTIHVRTDANGNPYIVPSESDTNLTISPDNQAGHTVEITGTRANANYGFRNLDPYESETVKIAKETEYIVNLPKQAGETTAPSIRTSKYNTGETVIEPAGDGNNRMPSICSSKEGDRVTVGDQTYITGPVKDGESTKYRVDPKADAEPNVILETGSLGLPKDTSIQVKGKVIKNTGAADGSDSSVQVNAEGEIDIPNGGGVTIDGVQISVPAATPMNGNTTIVLDENGRPHIKTTGGSDVTITVPGKNGQEKTYTYKAGDYDCELEIGEDGIPVLKNGDIRLKPGQIIKDSEGNEYQGADGETVTIMTTPKVYETDDDGNTILVGGGDMGFEIPKNAGINCKPNGQEKYQAFENPGNSDGFFTMDPAKAAEGLQSDSNLGLAAGKTLNLKTGTGGSVTVEAPKTGNKGTITVDGSNGSITSSKAGDTVIIDGKTYVATKDDTILTVDENGVSLAQGGLRVDETGAVTDALKVTADGSAQLIREPDATGGQAGQTRLEVTDETAFTIASVSEPDAQVTLVPGTGGTHDYVLGEDGTLTLSKGESIVRKGTKDVTIQAPADADITLKPLAKASKEDVESGYGTPASGLIAEVPNGNKIKIGKNTYQAVELDRGYTKETENAPTLPLQLVLGEDGSVTLHDGTVEVDGGGDIGVYDVNQKLATITNRSEDADHKIQVTNPGIVTMPKAGTTVSMKENGQKKSSDFTSTSDDTQIVFSPEISALKKGGVSLGKNEKIMIGETVIKNPVSDDKPVIAERTESIRKVTVTEDGQTIEKEEFFYTGKVTIPQGGSFEASYPDAANAVTYTSNDPAAEQTEFEINEDGNIVMPDGAIASIRPDKKDEVQIQANGTGIESAPTPDGILFAVPKGASITVNGKQYTNVSDDETLVLAVDSDGKVILVQGDVALSEGSIVYVENEQKGLVPIANKNTSGETAQTNQKIKVSYAGTQEQTDETGQVTDVIYPQVSIEVPQGNQIGVGSNEYSSLPSSTGSVAETVTKIGLDLTKNTDSAVGKNDISESKVTLKEGAVDMSVGSGISVGEGADRKVLSNIGASDSKEEGAAVRVTKDAASADVQVKMPTNSGVISKDASGRETKIELPKNDSAAEDYQAEISLKQSGSQAEVRLTPASDASGSQVSGSDKKILINGGTYISQEPDRNLTLEIDTANEIISMGGETKNVGLSGNASVTVGDTKITAGAKEYPVIRVKEVNGQTGSGTATTVPQVDIPNGGEANFNNPKINQNLDVTVPEKEEGEGGGQQIHVDPENGQLSTSLKKDDKVVISGIEYTGTSDDETKDHTIQVDAATGALVDGGEGSAKPDVIAKIDAGQFNKPNYRYTIPAGGSVFVGGVEYQAPDDSSLDLIGNPDGNPIVEIKNAGGTVRIGDRTYMAGNADSRFYVDDNGNLTLTDNGNPAANSSLKLGGGQAQQVNGVTYRTGSPDDAYTVTYGKNGCEVTPEDGTRLWADIPEGSTIYVASGAVEAKNESGETVTETFDGPLPIHMKGANGSVCLDRSVKDHTDTTYVSAGDQADMKLSHTGEGETGALSAIEILARKKQPASSSGSSSGAETKTDQTNDPTVTITNKENGKETTIAATTKDDKVVIGDIPKEVLDVVVRADETGEKSISMDCSSLEKSKVELQIDTIDEIAKRAEKIQIITKGADIILDKPAMQAIVEQASGSTIEIKASDEDYKELLNQKQTASVTKYDVQGCIDAYVVSNGTRIHDFKTGVVRVGIPWKIGRKKKASYYHIYYVSASGAMKYYDTTYEDGKLWFETNHFSEYVVVYDNNQLNQTVVDHAPLLASAVKVTKNAIRVDWKAVEGAQKYEVYAALCNTKGKKYSLKKVAALKADKTRYVIKGLKAGTFYKIVVRAVQGNTCLKKSCTLHVITAGGNTENASQIQTAKKKIQLKQGKTAVIQTRFKKTKKTAVHGQEVRFVSGNREVATVDQNGKVTAKHAGTCQIYAILNSGEYTVIQLNVKA